MTPPKGILFCAAGFGTRMRPLTDTRPKPLIKVGGKPLLTHALDQTRGMAIPNKVVNAHYLADQIAAYAGAQGLALSHETPDILDTGGGLKRAAPMMGGGPVFTLNTDAVWRGASPLADLAKVWEPARMGALLLCLPAARATGHKGSGDFAIDENGRLSRGGDLVYLGAQIIDSTLATDHPEDVFSLNALWTQLADEGRLFGTVYSGAWCDVGHPGGISLAEALLEGRG